MWVVPVQTKRRAGTPAFVIAVACPKREAEGHDYRIRKLSSFFPRLSSATSQRGRAPRPAHVSPLRLRYFGGTFLAFTPPREEAGPISSNFAKCRSTSPRCPSTHASILSP